MINFLDKKIINKNCFELSKFSKRDPLRWKLFTLDFVRKRPHTHFSINIEASNLLEIKKIKALEWALSGHCLTFMLNSKFFRLDIIVGNE